MEFLFLFMREAIQRRYLNGEKWKIENRRWKSED